MCLGYVCFYSSRCKTWVSQSPIVFFLLFFLVYSFDRWKQRFSKCWEAAE